MAYRSLDDYLFAKASYKKIPLMGTLELSPVCNLNCHMCYLRRTPGQLEKEGKRLRDWKEWLELARQLHDAGTLYILLTGGEPFLYPHFRDLYMELHRMGFLLHVNTNGTVIDGETVAWLKQAAPARINITLYGASRETYARICGQPDGFDRAARAITLLKEAGFNILVNVSLIPENAGDLEQIAAFCRERDIPVKITSYMFPPVRREREAGDSRMTPEMAGWYLAERIRFVLQEEEKIGTYIDSQLALLEDATEEEGSWGSHREEYMWCRAGRCTFWVSWEGVMTACGLMPFPIETHPFEEPFLCCWDRLNEKVCATPVMEGCAGCEKKKVCRPCASQIYAETGSVHEKAPYLCTMADCTIQRMREIRAQIKDRQ